MKRRRWERHQPVIRARKVCRLGLVKTWRNSCRMARKLGVSCMSGLLAVRDPGVLSTTRIPQNGNEADLFHASLPVRKSAKPELSTGVFRPLALLLEYGEGKMLLQLGPQQGAAQREPYRVAGWRICLHKDDDRRGHQGVRE